MSKIIQEVTKKTPKIIKDVYEPKKIKNLEVVEHMENKISESGVERMMRCSTYNEFIETAENSEGETTTKLFRSMSCGKRTCPICAYKKARKDAYMLGVMMKAIEIELGYQFLFVTLTTPNVIAEEVKAEIDLFNHSHAKMRKRKVFEKVSKGFLRKLEMTYNEEREDYNPHVHMIVAVTKSYFTNPNLYMTKDDWLKLWQSVTKNNNITQVHVQRVGSQHKNKDADSAVMEIAKYAAKDSEMLLSQKVFDTFYQGLRGRQLITFNKVFKDYRLKYECGALDKYKDPDKNEYINLVTAEWGGDRFNTRTRKLTQAEHQEIQDMKNELLERIDDAKYRGKETLSEYVERKKTGRTSTL